MSTEINILHDGSFNIATGKDRRTRTWKNREMKWSDLVLKLSETHYTAETHAEYIASKKTRQDEIKDIGGFVGGYLAQGRRLNSSVVHRQLVTLDIDNGKSYTWDDFTMCYGCAAAIYSTHKHSPQAPRLRLVIPLDREVLPDEYMAISRRIAGVLGIDDFDHTTFQPSRLMYWPSTSKDGEFFFQYQDGEWLNTDEILSSYTDWRDSSEWPVSTKEGDIIFKSIQKQGDPVEKPGLIGAFCRTFNIHEAIEFFLSDAYETCDVENRYTYKEGSTSAGLVVYDDKYAYSHHGTDPVSGRLCNAFDLVRIHKYGLKDEDVREGTPVNKMPSHLAMELFAAKDEKVKITIGSERSEAAKNDFYEIEILEDDDDSWRAKLECDRKGNYYPTIDNIVIILQNDPAFKNNIAFDEFENRPIVKRNLPWRIVSHESRFLIDRDDHNIEHYIEHHYKISTTKLEKALSVIYEKNVCHPVREYLNSLEWDGEKRVDSLLIDYMGSDDNEYTRATIRKALVAAVARIFRPGIKFDYVLTLVGEEGKQKSSLLKKLGREWFTDTFNLHMLQGKEGYEQLRGVWFIEIGELAGMAKAEVERVKGFVSAQEDRYRQAYGRRVENYPRQCVFFGTTNKTDFLKGQHGNRRFWPVLIRAELAEKNVFTDLDENEVNQIWAEAVVMYRKGESLFLPDRLEKMAKLVQKDHTEEHPWTGIVRDFLDKKLPANWGKMNKFERIEFLQGNDELQPDGIITRTRVCVAEIWTEALARRDAIDERSATAIRGIMRSFDDWEEADKLLKYGSYGPQRRGYIKTGAPIHFEEKGEVTEGVTTR